MVGACEAAALSGADPITLNLRRSLLTGTAAGELAAAAAVAALCSSSLPVSSTTSDPFAERMPLRNCKKVDSTSALAASKSSTLRAVTRLMHRLSAAAEASLLIKRGDCLPKTVNTKEREK